MLDCLVLGWSTSRSYTCAKEFQEWKEYKKATVFFLKCKTKNRGMHVNGNRGQVLINNTQKNDTVFQLNLQALNRWFPGWITHTRVRRANGSVSVTWNITWFFFSFSTKTWKFNGEQETETERRNRERERDRETQRETPHAHTNTHRLTY